MAQEQSADGRPDRPEIVEWGDDDGRRPARTPRALASLLRDRRLVPVIAGLGVVAVFASLVGEWTVMTIPNAGPEGTPARLPTGVADAGAFGTAYVVGLLAVAGSLALTLFGTPAARHNARILGAATAAVLLVVLGAATASVGDAAERMSIYTPNDKLSVEHGRGLIMAYVGTAALGLALYLAGRFIPALVDATSAGHPAAQASGAGDPAAHDDWRWRRRRRTAGTTIDDGEGPPVDLTVSPTAPFALPEQQDRR